MNQFVSLHQHTEWSALDGLVSIKDLVTRAKEYGMPGVAITDHGTMSGVFKFYEECKAQGLNPIIGEEFYIAKRKMTDKEPEDQERYHLTVLAKNIDGLKNLFKLSSLSYEKGFYYKPRIDEDTLKKYGDGLIVLSGCHSSKISQLLVGDEEKGHKANPSLAKQMALDFKNRWGDDFYLEIQVHGLKGSPRPWSEQIKLNKAVINLSKDIGVKVVLTADSHYLDLKDTETHEVLLCIGTANDYEDKNRWTLRDFDLSFPKPENVYKWCKDEYGTAEYCENTIEINNKVNIDWKYGSYLIPKFNTGKYSEYDYLKWLAWKGMEKKCPEHLKDKEYLDRFKFELDMLNKMGYLGYFLIVQEYVNWAKNNGIGVGPSRGSCAGSLLAYLLNIIEVNPMEVGTLFERFINPERPTMPDIDVDFEDSRRIEVVQHVTEKYGKDCVCNILILNYLKTKSAFKDVARVFKLPFKESNDISSLIPQDKPAEHHKLIDALEVPEIKSLYDKNPKIKTVFDYALQLEGKPRNHGVHACGIIIAPEPLTNYIPLEIDKDGKTVSQFPPEDLEKLGLLKMDFLGLSTVSIIQNTLKYVPELNTLYDIPTDDKETYKTFQEGRSYHTFQFNTPLARETCKKMLPSTIRELSDVTAIARPGPMENIPVYAERKQNPSKVSYINKWAKKYFSDTYGLNIYQEQGMLYLQEAAGFSKAQADFWRKGVAKAKMDILADLYPKYLEGSKKNGIPEAQAKKWWEDQIEGGAYTFNLSHAYAYAWIGYITCYLLTHYPAEYLSAVANNWTDDKDKLSEIFASCKELGIPIERPFIESAGMGFVPKNGRILYGLNAIKGLGKGASEILNQVSQTQPKTLEDLLLKVDKGVLNKTKLYGLLCAGSLDNLIKASGLGRYVLLEKFEDLLKWREKALKPLTQSQIKKGMKKTIEPLNLSKFKIDRYEKYFCKRKEKEATGQYMGGHIFKTLYGKEQVFDYVLDDKRLEPFTRTNEYGRAITSLCTPLVYGIVESAERKVYNENVSKQITVDVGSRTLDLRVYNQAHMNSIQVGHIYGMRFEIGLDKKGRERLKLAMLKDITPRAPSNPGIKSMFD